jgi:hypothetical protein
MIAHSRVWMVDAMQPVSGPAEDRPLSPLVADAPAVFNFCESIVFLIDIWRAESCP